MGKIITIVSQYVTKETEDKKVCFLPSWLPAVCFPHGSLWSSWWGRSSYQGYNWGASSTSVIITTKRTWYRIIPPLLNSATDTWREGSILWLAVSKMNQVLAHKSGPITSLGIDKRFISVQAARPHGSRPGWCLGALWQCPVGPVCQPSLGAVSSLLGAQHKKNQHSG